ncbi:MAG: hypothetical protein V1720_11525 [bacterium]
MKSIFVIIIIVFFNSLYYSQIKDTFLPGQKAVQNTAEKFAPSLVSTDGDQYGVAVNADWTELYYTSSKGDISSIMVIKRTGEKWSNPIPVSFSGKGNDSHPSLSKDGKKLYFVSMRSCPGAKHSLNLFCSDKKNDSWGTPYSFGSPVTDQVVHAPSVSASGDIYASGIVFLQKTDKGYKSPQKLKPDIKGSHPAISPDGSYIVFCALKSGGFGSNDLYVTFRKSDGTWGNPINLGSGVNTKSLESSPTISHDGKFLFFSRNGDIWWISTNVIKSLLQK